MYMKPKIKKLGPKEAAQAIMDDIVLEPHKNVAVSGISTACSDFYLGNTVLNKVYGTLTQGQCSAIDASFDILIYKPLGFELVAKTAEDIPADVTMMEHLGQMIKERY